VPGVQLRAGDKPRSARLGLHVSYADRRRLESSLLQAAQRQLRRKTKPHVCKARLLNERLSNSRYGGHLRQRSVLLPGLRNEVTCREGLGALQALLLRRALECHATGLKACNTVTVKVSLLFEHRRFVLRRSRIDGPSVGARSRPSFVHREVMGALVVHQGASPSASVARSPPSRRHLWRGAANSRSAKGRGRPGHRRIRPR